MRMIFVNLPVKDLEASKRFFGALGFTFNAQFTDETAACMVVEENISVMLLTEEKFRTFIKGDIADRKTTEVLIAISADSRAAVDTFVETALAAGGESWREPADHGFMYERSVRDLDGHVWEILWMDPAHVQRAEPAEAVA